MIKSDFCIQPKNVIYITKGFKWLKWSNVCYLEVQRTFTFWMQFSVPFWLIARSTRKKLDSFLKPQFTVRINKSIDKIIIGILYFDINRESLREYSWFLTSPLSNSGLFQALEDRQLINCYHPRISTGKYRKYQHKECGHGPIQLIYMYIAYVIRKNHS